MTHDVRHRRIQLVGELSSSLGASSLKNLSTVSGSHSLSKAVFFLSVTLFGLICSKHGITPPVEIKNISIILRLCAVERR